MENYFENWFYEEHQTEYLLLISFNCLQHLQIKFLLRKFFVDFSHLEKLIIFVDFSNNHLLKISAKCHFYKEYLLK